MEPTEPATLSRRDRERLTRRDAMLDSARKVFAERGYANATLEEVAQRAEFGKGTLYNYFPGGKEEILFAILDDLYDRLLALIEECLGEGACLGCSTRTTFRAFIQSMFEFYDERGDLFMIAIKEAARHMFGSDPDKAAYFLNQRDRLVGRLAVEVQRFMSTGELKQLTAESVAHLLLGNINGFQTHANLCQRSQNVEPLPADDRAELLTTILFDGLLTGKPESVPRAG